MKIAYRYVAILFAAFVIPHASPLRAQGRDRAAGTEAGTDLAVIGNGWSALGAGRADDAVKAADTVLARKAGDHRAVDLKIEALSSSQPLRALDAYETWLSRTRIEDVFLLAPIARGTLEQVAAGADPVLQKLALRRLADSGDARAGARLLEMSKGAGVTDLQRALDGDAAAATRLIQSKAVLQLPPHTLARVLPAAGAAAVPTLRGLLKHPAAPVRMEAALSLGKLGATDAIPELKALMGDPEVRSYAAVALTRLGDADGEQVVQELLQSPVLDLRVLGAQAYEGKEGPWVQALMPALKDPNGLTRVRAAELLAPVAPEAARPVLLEAAKDPNPVVRADVMRILERTEMTSPPTEPGADTIPGANPDGRQGLATLRQLLRDADPTTRLYAAGAILNFVRGGK
jgi:HEAT repeat protein